MESPIELEEVQGRQPNPKPTLKTKMAAHEARLKAIGADPGKSVGEGELFTEKTTSVLACENGGVIRLSTAVTPGQLLFLANEESKGEVIAQVKRKRAYGQANHVELEFAEPAPDFWGMEASAAAALLPRNTQEEEAAAELISTEASAGEPSEPLPAPTAEDVQALKREVEAAREQLKLKKTAAASEQAADPIPAVGDESLPVKHDPVLTPWTAAEQALLPKPSLDFSMSLPKSKRLRRARGSFTPGFRGGVLRLALLTTALVVTAVGAAWYKHWIPWKPAAKKPSVRVAASAVNPKTATPPGSQDVALVHSELSNTKVASDAPVTSPGTPPQSAALPTTLPTESADASESAAQPSASSKSASQPAVTRTSRSTTLAGRRSTVRPMAKPVSDSVPPAAAESAMVPPKLIKSVRALASLEALRDFETGNVVIDAVVGTAGEVNFISVLSGPPSLRAAAMEALKQYRYEPATRSGQPVPAHVTITIHFRFEP